MNSFAAAGRWLNQQENAQMSNTKWVFVTFFNVEVNVVLDRQPLSGKEPLPAWLRNLSHSRAKVGLDTFADNLCLWRCIAINQGARPDRSTQAARELAKSYLKLRTAPNDVPRTLLDELDEVGRYPNEGLPLSDWLGIRLYEPECYENGGNVWHLRENPSDKL